MAHKPGVHVVPHKSSDGSDWQVKREGAQRASGTYDTQAEAESVGREIARNNNSEFYLHNREGVIRERDSYGNDPFPPKG
jgi:hypothetical protein